MKRRFAISSPTSEIVAALLVAASVAGWTTVAAAEECKTGCASVPAPSADISHEEIAGLIAEIAEIDGTLDGDVVAYEALLFHARSVATYLDGHETPKLSAERRRQIDREVRRTEAVINLRVIDEAGVVRARLDDQRVRLGEKAHLQIHHTQGIQPIEYSGTVVRTGAKHLWARL